MAKMMMGQIDHARKRVQELKTAKYGDKPKSPTVLKGTDLLKELRAGKVTVSPAKLRIAFDNYVEEVPVESFVSDSGNYRNNYKDQHKITKTAPTSVQGALAAVIYAAENAAEIRRYREETELYDLRQVAINIKATEVEDAIVLGDQAAALIALTDFAAFEV